MSERLYPVRLYIKHIPNAILLGLALLGNILTWGWLLWYIKPTEELIFLHYNILFGVDLIGPWWRVLYLPIGGFLIFLFNTIIGWILFPRDRFANYILLFVSFLCQALLFVTAVLLVFLNV